VLVEMKFSFTSISVGSSSGLASVIQKWLEKDGSVQ
jgi:hypothetical protein